MIHVHRELFLRPVLQTEDSRSLRAIQDHHLARVGGSSGGTRCAGLVRPVRHLGFENVGKVLVAEGADGDDEALAAGFGNLERLDVSFGNVADVTCVAAWARKVLAPVLVDVVEVLDRGCETRGVSNVRLVDQSRVHHILLSFSGESHWSVQIARKGRSAGRLKEWVNSKSRTDE